MYISKNRFRRVPIWFIYDGIVHISTAGMGAQSRLHAWRFGSRKRIVIEIMRVKVCDNTSLTETHMAGDMDNHISLTDRKLLFVISRKRSVFAVLL
jgi:hypothetical protein